MNLIKEINNCREKVENEWEAHGEIVKMLEAFVRNASPYGTNMTKYELKQRMRDNGAENFHEVGNMLFAVEKGSSGISEGFRFSVINFDLKCYNNRMFGIFKEE